MINTRMRYRPKTYAQASEGQHQAVLADFFEKPSGSGQLRLLFIWLTDELDDEDKPIAVLQSFNRTWHPSGHLRAAVHEILGRDPGDDFDLEELIGVNVLLAIEHDPTGKYANVQSLARAPKEGKRLQVPEDYVRHRDRASRGHTWPAPAREEDDPIPDDAGPITDADVPF